ncbi:hypothetical protein, partial [Actinocrinis puniceicyclus]|uniref:hypothetical protein n=1 Tax=Actinocrinis puniceicyclus TaxID=977794 RepID=UPI0028ACE8AD
MPARGDGQLDQRGTRHDDRAQHAVVLRPRHRLLRHAAGEQPVVAVADADGGGQQRMVGPAQSGGGRVACLGAGHQPEAFPLEGVRRQAHPPRTRTRIERRPVHLNPSHMRLRQEPRERLPLIPLRTQRRREHRSILIHTLPRQPGQHT